LSIQANNAYIFTGFGLGLVILATIRVHDDMLLAACKWITNYYIEVPLHIFFDLFIVIGDAKISIINSFGCCKVHKGIFKIFFIYPPFSNIRKISANIPASVAACQGI